MPELERALVALGSELEFPATGDQVFMTKKILGSATQVEGVELGRYGLWLHGGKHVLMWSFGPGEPRRVDTRLAGNVLIWLVGDTTYRLEGALDKGQMLQLAHQ